MAIPDFFAQQQQALNTGMGLGRALQNYQMNQQSMDIRSAQEERDKISFEEQMKAQKEQAIKRNLVQDAAIFASMDDEAQLKLIPELQKKYRANPELSKAIGSMKNKNYRDRVEGTLLLLQQLQDPGKQQMTAGEREFEAMTKGFTEEEKDRARRIKARLIPGAVGSSAITMADQGRAEQVAAVEETISGAKERGKLKEQLDLSPQIQYAVNSAKNIAEFEAKKVGKDKSDSSAWNVYSAGMKGLIDGLEGADTGPFIGRLPAVTTAQQIAEGGVSAMAPILKQMFRTAGEGTFTDKDQDLLMNMLPTRKDSPEAVQAKLANINSIVMAKLNIEPEQNSPSGLTIGGYTVEVIE